MWFRTPYQWCREKKSYTVYSRRITCTKSVLYYEHLLAPQCVIYSIIIIKWLFKVFCIHALKISTGKCNTHENVVNLFTSCMSMYMNL